MNMPDTPTAAVSSLPFGAIIRLPDDRLALFYYDKYEPGPGDEYVKKAQFWVDDAFVILGRDEEVEVVALPLETASAMLPRLMQAQPELRTKLPGTPPKRRHDQDHWFRPEHLSLGAIVYLPTGGLALFRGRVPEGAATGKYTVSTEHGDDLTLPANRLIRQYGDPVQVARWYLKHAAMSSPIELPMTARSSSDAPPASEPPHPLQSLLPLVVEQRIRELATLTDDEFVQRWAEWRDEAVADPRFASEVVLYGSKKPGESAAAFNQLAQVIAVLAFVPGGVTVFNHTWCGHSPMSGGSAHDQAPEDVPTE